MLIKKSTVGALCLLAFAGCHDPGADVRWIDMIVPHHELAIQMAEQVLERGARPEVRDLARSIKETQLMEIAS